MWEVWVARAYWLAWRNAVGGVGGAGFAEGCSEGCAGWMDAIGVEAAADDVT
jgi:hypothetical protein